MSWVCVCVSVCVWGGGGVWGRGRSKSRPAMAMSHFILSFMAKTNFKSECYLTVVLDNTHYVNLPLQYNAVFHVFRNGIYKIMINP